MSDDANLAGLSGSFRLALANLEGAESSVSITRGRADGAAQFLARLADGSSNDLLADAMSLVAQSDQQLEEIAARYAMAREKITEYMMSKGLG